MTALYAYLQDVAVTAATWLAVYVTVVCVGVSLLLSLFKKKTRKKTLSVLLGATLVKWVWGSLAGGSGGRQRRRPPPQPLESDDMWAACPLSRWGKADRRLDACRWCNGPLPERATEFCGQQCRDIARGNHYFSDARKLRRWTDGHACTQCGKTGAGVTIEVDHIERAHGRHNVPGCIHHQSNLQSLCGGGGRSCHQRRTNQQRRRAS